MTQKNIFLWKEIDLLIDYNRSVKVDAIGTNSCLTQIIRIGFD